MWRRPILCLLLVCAGTTIKNTQAACESLKDEPSCSTSTEGCTWYGDWDSCWATDGKDGDGKERGECGSLLDASSCNARSSECTWWEGYGCWPSSEGKESSGKSIAGSLTWAGSERTWMKYLPSGPPTG